MPGSSATSAARGARGGLPGSTRKAIPCGPSWTLRKLPTPCPVPWSKSSPASQRGARARASSCPPVVPRGKRARARETCPLRTRVKRSRISPPGRPSATVRVMSVVPAGYWPPLSTR